MVTVIVLIDAELSRIRSVAQAISEMEHVDAVYSVAGRYDIVAVLRLPRLEDVETVVPGVVDQVDGVTGSETMVAFRTYSSAELDAAYDLGLD